MLLEEIIHHTRASLRHLERFVNDGSPSGFTEANTTRPETSPFGNRPHFHLFTAHGCSTREYGVRPAFAQLGLPDAADWIFVHPDMATALQEFSKNHVFEVKESNILATPTASGRTVQLAHRNISDFVKLHYAGILGRIRRELPYEKAIAGPETSAEIERALVSGILPRELCILEEPYARIMQVPEKDAIIDWGMVWRKSQPFGDPSIEIDYQIPCFSLFSVDRCAMHHPPLLKQIIDRVGGSAKDYLFQKIIEPTIRCYFELILRVGLQPEWNAQNLLYGFTKDWKTVVIIARDLESVDKDLSLRQQLGLFTSFESYPYKCIDDRQYNYQIKHSFMFDFKLGECVLAPVGDLAETHYGVSRATFDSEVKAIVEKYVARLPKGFFPQRRWYSFARVLVDQSRPERPYIENLAPRFRST